MDQLTRPGNRILVLRGGAIGDFILTLPVFAALRRDFPRSRIEVLGYPHIAQLAVAGGLVDEVKAIESPSLAGFFHAAGDLDANWIEYFRGVTLIISYLYDPEGILTKNLARICPARLLQGRPRPEESQNRHAVDVWLEPLAELGIRGANREPQIKLAAPEKNRNVGVLNLGAAAENWAGENRKHLAPLAAVVAGNSRAPSSRWLALHAGSGSEKKNWPEARWLGLLHKMWSETDWHGLLVGGEAEGERLQRLTRDAPVGRVRLAQSLPLVELAKWMLPCMGFVGHDSGITHLASALGLPGVVLWGPSNPDLWRPLSRKMTLLQSPRGLADLTVEQVFATIQLQLGE